MKMNRGVAALLAIACLLLLVLFLRVPKTYTKAIPLQTPHNVAFLPIAPRDPTPTPTMTIPLPEPTSTRTPTPTDTATPQPTAVAPGVYVLDNDSWYVDSIDYLHIVGEVWNNTNNNLRFVKITANVFNAQGGLVGTDFTYTWLDDLPAHEKTCFELSLPEPVNWAYYVFENPTYSTDGEPLPNLTIYNHSGSYNPTFGWYEIIGMVRNDHGTLVRWVSPVGTVYNATETVVGCDFTYVNSTDLNPGQESSFELTFLGRDYGDVTSYRLQVDGDPQ